MSKSNLQKIQPRNQLLQIGLISVAAGLIICHTRKKSGRYITDEWQESEHPRKANGQFGEGGGTSGKVAKFEKRDKIRKQTRKEVQLPKDEYARVMSAIRTNITAEQKKKKVFSKPIGNNIYRIENLGNHDYRIIGKSEI